MLNSYIEVSNYNEPYSLCQHLLPSPQSTLGSTRSTYRHSNSVTLKRARSLFRSFSIRRITPSAFRTFLAGTAVNMPSRLAASRSVCLYVSADTGVSKHPSKFDINSFLLKRVEGLCCPSKKSASGSGTVPCPDRLEGVLAI